MDKEKITMGFQNAVNLLVVASLYGKRPSIYMVLSRVPDCGNLCFATVCVSQLYTM